MASQDPATLFIGAGNMAQAILTGFKGSGGDMSRISVVDPFAEVELALELGLGGLFRRLDEIDAETCFDMIVLAVKPQIFDTFEDSWADLLAENGTIISIMAGVDSLRIREKAGKPCAVVRCMPNMAAAAGMSVNVAFTADPTRRTAFEMLFSGSGPVRWISTEDDIHLTTAISGSGPAYFFAFVEALALAGAKTGLSPDFALDLATDTLIGAGELLKRSRDPSDLRQSVTSKGGTTAAALAAFAEDNELETLVRKAVEAAIARSRDLSK